MTFTFNHITLHHITYIYVYIHIHIYTGTYTYIHRHMSHTYIYIHVFEYLQIYMCRNKHILIDTCLCACMYACIYRLLYNSIYIFSRPSIFLFWSCYFLGVPFWNSRRHQSLEPVSRSHSTSLVCGNEFLDPRKVLQKALTHFPQAPRRWQKLTQNWGLRNSNCGGTS